jgi:hypothetical protein
MEHEPTTSGERPTAPPQRGASATGAGGSASRTGALGDVARDVIDHTSMMVRDAFKIVRLEASRYVEHLRRDVGWRAAFGALAAATGVAALLCGLIAVFLGIASAIGSVAWAFAIYAALFAVGAVVLAALANRPVKRDVGEEIAQRFPAARMKESEPEHLLTAQRSAEEAHVRMTKEAAREAGIRP